MFFASDNWAGASERVQTALMATAGGYAPAYGADDRTKELTATMSALFERPVGVRLVATGTAANMMSLAALTPAPGVIFAHAQAHVIDSECGAIEFATGGALLHGIGGVGGKVTVAALAEALTDYPRDPRFRQPAALSLTQATECGTVYGVDEVRALTAFARDKGLRTHMDGARFGNAVAALGVSPAEITWRAGVDVLSFGGTKNGALMAEAVVFFDDRDLFAVDQLRQRTGHGVSKLRPLSAQFLALLAGGHWLDLARHANAMARRLADGLVATGGRIAWPTQANEVFAILPRVRIEAMRAAGASFYDWPATGLSPGEAVGVDETLVRLVCCFSTTPADVDKLVAITGA
jgi:threonine aldolase